MALSTFSSIWNEVLSVCPLAGPDRAKVWVRDAFREIAEAGPWSWLLGKDFIYIPAAYTTGTFASTQGSAVITGTTTVWTAAMAGRQFKYGSFIYDILSVDTSAQTLTLTDNWVGADVSGGSYSILQIYYTPPDDFHYWKSVIDPAQGVQLWTDLNREELDAQDPDRTYGAQPCALVYVDTSVGHAGYVGPVVKATGTAAVNPASGGTYTGADDAVFTAEITTTGAVGVSDFSWKKNEETATTGVATDSAAITLQEGVTIAFPAGTYTDGAVFVFHVRTITTPGLPRYEIYPHQSSARQLTTWYMKRPTDPEDSTGVLPRYIRGDVIKEGALARAAWWPGTEKAPNSYAGIARAKQHQENFEKALDRLATQDNEVIDQRVIREILLPFASLPWGGRSGNIDQLRDLNGFSMY